ncbi:hypothetical protein SNE40_003718 [Patella caerulea]|uniref:ADP-ribosyl cyclase/cyclic ADP-ribose hydrolase n=1 Tax=Patella caerulea TaxID=87958 RepID=A0AAN8KAE6_PATCE
MDRTVTRCESDSGVRKLSDMSSNEGIDVNKLLLERSQSVVDLDASRLLERSQSDAALLRSAYEKGKFHEATFSTDRVQSEHVPNRRERLKIADNSTVFFDLAESDEGSPKLLRSKSRKEPILDTIKQEEVLNFRRHSMPEYDSERDSAEPPTPDSDDNSNSSNFYAKYPLHLHPGSVIHKYGHNLKLSYQTMSQQIEDLITSIKDEDTDENGQCNLLGEILSIIETAWYTPIYGRDLAYGLCDIVKLEGLLDILIQNCTSSNHQLLKCSVDLLEQVMSTKNRERLARVGLDRVVRMTCKAIGDTSLAKSTVGVLENLFKLSEETCSKVINLGGLDVILHWCRCSEIEVLRRCAKALANLSLFGGCENQEFMAKHKVPEWLFPLAFSDDNSVRYYACLATSALVANKELEAKVSKSGTLDLVLPFINSNRPSSFAASDLTHKQGRDKIWLKHLIPLLFSRRMEAQTLAAFHFAMESYIKAEQGRTEIFHEIDAVEPLKKIASSPNAVASKLAVEALKIIGEKIPHKLSQQVPLWTVDDVIYWVSQVGFTKYKENFYEEQIDGDLLLTLNCDDLKDGLNMQNSVVRKRFMRELKSLKITADYSSCDPTSLDNWLMRLSPDLSQYTYHMLRQGVDKFVLQTLCEEELRNECAISNSIHRKLILQHLNELVSPSSSCQNIALPLTDHQLGVSLGSGMRTIDVFISYRRSNGSQLASLLKVHLQIRGFSVFLDIERLRAGKFDENLLLSIKLSRNFVLILTPESLDRCIGDTEREDWVHKEIVAALESNCNIIPVMDNFNWPLLEKLPVDMHPVVRFNSVKWIHDYQEACVDRLETFLRGDPDKDGSPLKHKSSAYSIASSPSSDDLYLKSETSNRSMCSLLNMTD